ncbi:citrate synthase-like protein [Jimgerdemannia flammicorona]|uniref:Citrate synthase n=1 Tax=Jimgerdemannia flammicorona TaxID=994334 RepID=A0A433Q4N8_9FUNG|nr:citrate synthase-like protein [Jimgerdemannia flammicorona]
MAFAKSAGRVEDETENGLRVYDPGFQNTAVARSSITYINGDEGILHYRGYPIEELAENSSYLEVAYLLIYGELPTPTQFAHFEHEVMHHTFAHTKLTELMQTFNYDAHPMVSLHHLRPFLPNPSVTISADFTRLLPPQGCFITGIAAMSTFHPEANPALQGADVFTNNPQILNKQIFRLLGKSPTLAAHAYRHRIGRPANSPQNGLSYTENFLYMLDRLSEREYKPNKQLARALDILFILHAGELRLGGRWEENWGSEVGVFQMTDFASCSPNVCSVTNVDHELNCSTAAMRHIGSSRVDPYSAVAGASAALYGPLHGGANEAVLRMLERIGSAENVGSFLGEVKARRTKLFGFGHRIYKNYDPRARIVRKVAYDVFDIVGREPLIEVAIELERAALADEYFVSRKLYPNVDYWSGLIYKAMGFPTDMFPVLFAIPRVSGWLAHWKESLEEKDAKIWRPRQIYVGPPRRSFVPLSHREQGTESQPDVAVGTSTHPFRKRSKVATYKEGSGDDQ